jgi:hypothetical protein
MIALGKSTPNEMVLMVTEKLNAMEEAKTIMMLGGSASHVIDNTKKLSRPTLRDCQILKRTDLAPPQRWSPGHVRSTFNRPV